MKVADIVGGIIGILIGLFALWEGAEMPADVVMKIGPSFFPNILGGLLILFSAVLIVNAVRGRSKGKVEPYRLSDKGVQRGLITLAAGSVFVLVVEPIGFIPTAIVFLTFMMRVMGKRNPLLLAVTPALITAAVWLVFEKVLALSMPAGVLADYL